MASYLHHAKVEIADGLSVMTRITLDGTEIRGVRRIRFDSNPPGGELTLEGRAVLTLELEVDLEFAGDVRSILAELRPREARAVEHLATGLDCWCQPYVDPAEPTVIIHRKAARA
jgi:hypothetical protein